ncbi:hypothetical protein J4468_03340 [Candidatus Woesearchaeota archaeon]|nr:hypothetical protein [Candidatus Woesearchaeota archaeon]
MAQKKQLKKLLKKKRKWLSIYAKGDFKNIELGETFLAESADLKGKTISADLSKITGDMKKQNTHLTFVVTEVKDNAGYADLISYSLSTMYVKRLRGSSKDKIEESFIITGSDGLKARIKPLIVLRSQVHSSVRSAARRELKAYFDEVSKTENLDSIFRNIISSNIQKQLRERLKKVYPVQISEIKSIRRL